MSQGNFRMIPLKDGKLLDPNIYLPGGGNYKTECIDCRVIMCIPNYEKPSTCIMTCKCPKDFPDGSVKYYPARIQYSLTNDSVSTKRDGKIFIGTVQNSIQE